MYEPDLEYLAMRVELVGPGNHVSLWLGSNLQLTHYKSDALSTAPHCPYCCIVGYFARSLTLYICSAWEWQLLSDIPNTAG